MNNSSPHAFKPNPFYEYVLCFIKELKQYGILLQDLVKCKVNLIYRLLLVNINKHNQCNKWGRLHSSYLPNYLNSFNYKVHFNLLPVRSKFTDYLLDNESRCPFCDFGFETLFHIMGKCKVLNVVWNFLDEVMIMMNINYSFSTKRKLLHDFEVMSITCQSDSFRLVLYLTTIINYHLWKTRNDCVHEKVEFDCAKFINKLIRSTGARARIQKFTHFPDSKMVPKIDELFHSLVTLRNIMFDNG